MGDFGEDGFAKPWLQFEKDLGLRPLLLGNLDQCIETYTTKIGAALVSKFTFPAPDASVKTEDRTVEGIKIRIYTPENYTGNKPICVFTHGGGWCMGDLDVEDANCRTIASGGGVKVVSMDYRLGPQHPFPAGFDDCVKITEWVLEYGSSLNATPGKILLAGVSAGGGICLTVALKLIDQGRGDVLQGVIAQVPATLHADAVPEELKSGYKSFKEHSRHTVNSDEAMYAFWNGLGASPTEKYAYPLLHPKIGEIPKAYITFCGHDTLADDARLLAKKLKENGVPHRVDEYVGYPHYFWTFPGSALAKPAAEYNDNLSKGVQWVLE